ncbi:MAG: hypothetical protein GXP42_16055 [Chloroflexi bacterium]|nr:hypothetical protein [Chloroflexota bacterium]
MIEIVRDLSIILLALEVFIVNIILVLLFWQIRSMVIVLREESRPVLRSTAETTETIKNTSQFLSNHVARPLIRAASFAAGLRGAAKTLKQSLSSESGANSAAEARPSVHSTPPPTPSAPTSNINPESEA